MLNGKISEEGKNTRAHILSPVTGGKTDVLNLARLCFFRESIAKPIEGRSPDLLHPVRLPEDFTSVARCTELFF
jgi:hypothetical protein